MNKRAIALVTLLALSEVSCSLLTIGVIVGGLGIAGAALETYCTINACPPVLAMYAPVIVSEAMTDVGILESGATTEVKVEEIIGSIKSEIAQGQAITGLSSGQINLLTPILDGLSSFLDHLNRLTPPPEAGGRLGARRDAVILLPKLTSKDRIKIQEMKAKVANIQH